MKLYSGKCSKYTYLFTKARLKLTSLFILYVCGFILTVSTIVIVVFNSNVILNRTMNKPLIFRCYY